jgi:hypothetical protein
MRQFESHKAVLTNSPLLIGLMGPPGGGKTFSALRLATGITQDRGGDIYLIDTEGGRAAKYASEFTFYHVPFDAPYKPSDFLDAVSQMVAKGAACVIIDSMSDEHEGPGGVLDWHEAELERMAGQDWQKRERVGMAAWIKPKADRRKLIDGLLRIKTPIIMCFRAREKVKQIKNDRGKMEPTNIGYQPIAPFEIVHNLDLNCLLPAKADGVPVWHSDKIGEDFTIKLPIFLRPFIQDGLPLDENMGKHFSEWARGGNAPPTTLKEPEVNFADLLTQGDAKAKTEGMVALGQWWKSLTAAERKALGPKQLETWKIVASAVAE